MELNVVETRMSL